MRRSIRFLILITALGVIFGKRVGYYELESENPVVEIEQGKVKGDVATSVHGRPFHRFRCIPYGKQERFEPSEPADAWEGIYDASKTCNIRCPQLPQTRFKKRTVFRVTEDCLYLNVHTPEQETNLHPVMVFIHGGGFAAGDGTRLGGGIFLDHDVVLVTINYRLNVFGFLTSGDGVLESNLGIKDMIIALQWVQTNIQNFGGDPSKVTIFGESAGAAAVALMILSPMTKGLFHNAIIQSGSAISPFSYQSNPSGNFATIVKALDCDRDTTEESVACLKDVDTNKILGGDVNTANWMRLSFPMLPAIENGENQPLKSKPFLPDHPRRLLEHGDFNRVPIIIGVTEDEMGFYFKGLLLKNIWLTNINYHWLLLAGPYMAGMQQRNLKNQHFNRGLRKLRRFYFGDDDATLKDTQEVHNAFSDSWFNAPMDATIRFHSQYAPVYPYIYTKKGSWRLGNNDSVGHGEEVLYQFYPIFAYSDSEFARNFTKLWVSFATHGKPTATWGSVETWPQAEPGTWDYNLYRIDDNASLVENPFKARVQFRSDLDGNEWDEVGETLSTDSPTMAKVDAVAVAAATMERNFFGLVPVFIVFTMFQYFF